MAVLFHGNFSLVRHRMAGLIKLALQQPELKDKALAEPFSYGAPFAAIYRSWLHKTGLTKLGLPLELTEMGKPNTKSISKHAVLLSWVYQNLLLFGN